LDIDSGAHFSLLPVLILLGVDGEPE
jgi:hypothetical protein